MTFSCSWTLGLFFSIVSFSLFPFRRVQARALNPFGQLLRLPFAGLHFVTKRRGIKRLPTIMFYQAHMRQEDRRIILRQVKRDQLLVKGRSQGSTSGQVNGRHYHRLTTHRRVITSASFLHSRVLTSTMISTLRISTRGGRILQRQRHINRLLIRLLTVKHHRGRLIMVAFHLRYKSAPIGQLGLRRRANASPRQVVIRLAMAIMHVVTRIVGIGLNGSFLLDATRSKMVRRSFGRFQRCNCGICSRLSTVIFYGDAGVFTAFT